MSEIQKEARGVESEGRMSTPVQHLALAPGRSTRRAAVVVKQIIVHQMMTADEVAAMLNMDVRAIWAMCSRARRGKGRQGSNPIPFYQPGGKGGELRFDYDEIRVWMRGTRS